MRSFLLIIFLCSLFSCQPTPDRPTKPTVLVSIVPYASFVQEIAGDSVQIELLVPKGADPHTYEPSPKQVQAAHHAKIWLRIGDPFEEKILKVLQSERTAPRTVQMWEGLPLLPLEEHAHCSHCHDHAHDDALDKHVWLSARLAKIQAQHIKEVLCELMPENRTRFENNFALFSAKLDQLDKEISRQLLPFKGRTVLFSHPAFGYFCHDYGLVQLSIEDEGKETLPHKIAATLREAEKQRIRCVITQGQYSPKAAELVAEKLQLPIFPIDPYAGDYFENLRQLANAIAQ